MKKQEIINILLTKLPPLLANDLVDEFFELKADCVTRTLGRASLGKFVETVVQCLQFLDSGNFNVKVNVDSFLNNLESSTTSLDDGLKICCSRIARAMYTLRNKRNILHKGSVDSNIYDLRLAFGCAQWILSELIRQAVGISMADAGKAIEYVQLPVNELVEEVDGRKIIHGTLSVEQEILIYMHSQHPECSSISNIRKSLDRRAPSSISNTLKKLWKEKKLHKNDNNEYCLTQQGFRHTTQILINLDQ